jgi:phosphatidylglycerophosphatase C
VFRPLVAFDFDGTLTCRDSLTDFLVWRAGRARFALGLAGLAGPTLAYARDRDRGVLKAALLKKFIAGTPLADLEAAAHRHAAERSRGLLRPDAVRLWKQWQARGARLVIVTASPEIVVAPFAHGLAASALIGTRLETDAAGRLTGALDGANCRGPEKVRRLREAFGEDVRLEAAYGDSDGDLEMLALAEEAGMKVFGGRP